MKALLLTLTEISAVPSAMFSDATSDLLQEMANAAILTAAAAITNDFFMIKICFIK